MIWFNRSLHTLAKLTPRSVIRFAAPILVSLTVVLIAAVLSIEMLSTIRAWVGGEGLYSKGQKNATYWLAQYALSHSDEDYLHYQAAIAFPLGDLKARLALQHRPPDLKAAWEGFAEGGSDRRDIGSIIIMFRLLGDVGPIRHAIDIWTQGDSYTVRLCAIAARLHSMPASDISAADQESIQAELNHINAELTPLSASFSSTLGELARVARDLLVAGLILGTVITALLCIGVTRARVIERDAKERGLARLSELYSALSQTSHLISRVGDAQRLFDEICRICVGPSGMVLAAVGLLNHDDQSIDFVAAHGAGQEYLQTLAGTSLHGGAAEALRAPLQTGSSRVFDYAAKPSGTFASQAAFPLSRQKAVIGVLCVFSREPRFFRSDIVELLEQLANEASFALDSLHRESDRQHQAALLADQNRILSLIASGAELSTILHTLAEFSEKHSTGAPSALITQESAGSALCLGVSPSMPAGFAQALTDQSGEPTAPPCFTSITHGIPVEVPELDGYAVNDTLREFLARTALQSLRAWPIVGSKGQVLGALAMFSRRDEEVQQPAPHLVDICTNLAGIAIESCRASDRIKHLAHHDDLTGLPNRLLFRYQLPQALARAQRSGGMVGVFFLDLDRFKVINDTLGHDAGDNVLRQIAKRLQACVRVNDSLARVGGDEFALLVEQFNDNNDLSAIARKMLTAIASPVSVDGHEYRLTGSIGIAIYPRDGTDGLALLKNADIAMYRAKASGRDNYQFYSNDINVHSLERLSLENQLRQAVVQGELEVYYQPKVDIRSQRIAGAEALVRWRHPQRGLLLPGAFLFVAEEVGLTGAIDNFVLDTVCADLVRWRQAGLPVTRIAVNLSAHQFLDSRLLDNLNRILRETSCDPQLLEFEITESVVMSSPDRALKLLERIKEYGITLAIDDFGTGHSSLAYLKRFPVDSVKIDYTFVRDLALDPDDLAIIKAIVALAHSLELKVVAEGVESVKQLEILRRCRCDEFQGFLASAAIPSEEFRRMLLHESELAESSSHQPPKRALTL